MSTKQRGYVPLTLDKQRRIHFGMNAFCALEEKGYDITALEQKGIKFSDIRAMLWAGLLHDKDFEDNPEWDEKAAGDLADKAENLQEVFKAVSRAVSLAFGQDPDTPKEQKPGN
ncbi:hypothetical protein [Paludifilum halophilum]|uniref:Uncharacterized protein n=1 Tax=Paludifilum halophilum TaxID=1642702 RepID=A0A235B8A6_9BACL|nr:hypothetical protein [Paludifilum halophilum]OYD08548.1 hypothetical protein CHM34_06895 [Paludifilum halophilum]